MIKKYKDKKWLYHEYIILEKSAAKIGRKYGMSRGAIWYWLWKHNISRRTISEAHKGNSLTEEHRAKIKEAWTPGKRAKLREMYKNKPLSKEHCAKLSAAWTLERRAKRSEMLKNKSLTEEHCVNLSMAISASWTPERIAEHSAKLKAWWTLERRAERSEVQRGKKSYNWKGGISFEPYCPAFNKRIREYIRNLCNRACIICGRSTLQNIDKNRKWLGRLAVDHTDENKMQGCDDWEWRLTPLCTFCHGRMNKQKLPHHLLLQLLLLNNKKHQTNFLFGEE